MGKYIREKQRNTPKFTLNGVWLFDPILAQNTFYLILFFS